ncbi:uncharacterized protein CCOS01_02890 [Colletotrichum costaricense]|uniref:Uncharacterized protein n=1 Tax=Colletotrichum costaricense TaxID=1209916 RepID=A0AAI9Z3T6_9PEZI|nr:uncharacterized protein CCOS01_02890 [Colletotrichum costaricense]KAK1534138.1 hypothetical protein CCOS01_02890 [Colletotrichum costaricense]
MDSRSNKSIVNGDDSPSSRSNTDAGEVLRLQKERLRLFTRDNECPNPMLLHTVGFSKKLIETHHKVKHDKVIDAISKIEK